jgi:hypothetical protein
MEVEIMELDYLMSNGRWMTCNERSEEFFNRCMKFNSKQSHDEILQKLNEGKELKYDKDWNNCVRSTSFAKEVKRKLEERMANYKPQYETVEEFDARDDER